MAASNRWTLRLGTALVCVLLMIQICEVHAAACSDDTEVDCCESTSQCPGGYYESQEACVSTTMAQQLTTTAISTTEELEDDTNTTQSNTTEGTTIPASTEPTNSSETTNTNTTDTSTASTYTTTPLDTNTTESTPAGTTVYCRPCANNCKVCNSSSCIECEAGFKRENGDCVSQDGFPLAAVIGGAVGGAVFIVFIVVIVVVCIKRRRPSSDYQPSNLVRNDDSQQHKPDVKDKEYDGMQVQHTSSNPIYENIPRGPGNLAVQIPRKQDSVLRYTRDPTLKRGAQPPTDDVVSQEHADDDDDEGEEVYANQEAFILNTLGEAPAPPTHAQTTVRRKRAADDIDQTGQDEDAQEIYENQEAVTARDSSAGFENVELNNTAEHTDDPVYQNYGFHMEDETPK